MTKSRRRSKFDHTAIDFDNIDVRNVKYLPPSFHGDVIFILPPITMDVSGTHGRSMHSMDKIYRVSLICLVSTMCILYSSFC
jgi:hypothetical protein